jgi:hypothetical protein
MGEGGVSKRKFLKARAATPVGERIGRGDARLNATGDQPADARQSGLRAPPSKFSALVWRLLSGRTVGAYRGPYFISASSFAFSPSL